MPYDTMMEMLAKFLDEQSCIAHLEQLRWPCGIICPLCGSPRKIHKRARQGIYKCGECKKEFSIRKGTIYEESRLPLRKWFVAAWLMSSSRKGVSSYQLAREIGVTQKTAWFVLGRLRKAAQAAGDDLGPMDGPVEADETYLGGKEKNKHASKKLHAGRGGVGKDIAIGLRSRKGRVIAQKATRVDGVTLSEFVHSNVPVDAELYTDDHGGYTRLSKEYRHEVVVHSVGEYVRGKAHTNGIESFWALLKRGYHGVFHHFTWKHLDGYLSEFSFRWNLLGMGGGARMNATLSSGFNTRLTYEEHIG